MSDSTPHVMLYLGHCRVCTTGPLGLRRCGGCGEISLLCDECDSVWPDAKLDGPPLPAEEGALPCPHCDADLAAESSAWATREEADACDWLKAAVKSGKRELSEGTAFTPRANGTE